MAPKRETPAALLARARHSAGLTQRELAERSGVHKVAISMYETGAREAGAATFLKLLEATGGLIEIGRFSETQMTRGRQLAELLELADALPHKWKGDHLDFPSHLWRGVDA